MFRYNHDSGDFFWTNCEHVSRLARQESRFSGLGSGEYIFRRSPDLMTAPLLGVEPPVLLFPETAIPNVYQFSEECGFEVFDCNVNHFSTDCEFSKYKGCSG